MALGQGTNFYRESSAPLTGSGTFTGASRDAIGSGGGATSVSTSIGASPWAYFNAWFYADQAGTAYIDASYDNVNWFTVATTASVSGSPTYLRTPIFAQWYRARMVNGATPQSTLNISSSFSIA